MLRKVFMVNRNKEGDSQGGARPRTTALGPPKTMGTRAMSQEAERG
jgi:hypothetical protein